MPIILDWDQIDRDAQLHPLSEYAALKATTDRVTGPSARDIDGPPTSEMVHALVERSRHAVPDERNTSGASKTQQLDQAVAHWEQPLKNPLDRFVNLRGPRSVLRRHFQHLIRWWKKDTRTYSSISRIVNHPAYQGIIAMGYPMVPLILRQLERQPDHFFTALKTITGQDPVPVRSRGKVREMAQAWMNWGRANNVRW